MPERQLLSVGMENGMGLTCTPSQPFKVLSQDLTYQWKEAKDLQAGDHLVMRLEYPDLPKVRLPDWHGKEMLLDEDIAYLMGQFLSDGWFENYHSRFNFFSSHEETMMRVQECLRRAFGYEATIEMDSQPFFNRTGTSRVHRFPGTGEPQGTEPIPNVRHGHRWQLEGGIQAHT
jgi:hypothetical protein